MRDAAPPPALGDGRSPSAAKLSVLGRTSSPRSKARRASARVLRPVNWCRDGHIVALQRVLSVRDIAHGPCDARQVAQAAGVTWRPDDRRARSAPGLVHGATSVSARTAPGLGRDDGGVGRQLRGAAEQQARVAPSARVTRASASTRCHGSMNRPASLGDAAGLRCVSSTSSRRSMMSGVSPCSRISERYASAASPRWPSIAESSPRSAAASDLKRGEAGTPLAPSCALTRQRRRSVSTSAIERASREGSFHRRPRNAPAATRSPRSSRSAAV